MLSEKNKKQMNVCCIANEQYAQHAAVTLVSLFETNPDLEFKIWILSDGLKEDTIKKLNIIIQKYNNEVFYIISDFNEIDQFPLTGYWSKLVYCKLLIPKYIPDNIKNILIIDVDIIFCNSVKELLEIDMTKYAIAGVEDNPDCIMHKKRLGLPKDAIYINGGFIWANLDKWRIIDKKNGFINYIKENTDKIKLQEQDVENAIFYSQILPLSNKWNLTATAMFYSPFVLNKYKKEIPYCKHHPIVVHFSSDLKPWHKELCHPYKYLYYKYIRLTPWIGFHSEYKYHRSMYAYYKDKLYYILHLLNIYKRDKYASLKTKQR